MSDPKTSFTSAEALTILNGKASAVASAIRDRATGVDTYEKVEQLRALETARKDRVTVKRALDEVEQVMRDDDAALEEHAADDDAMQAELDAQAERRAQEKRDREAEAAVQQQLDDDSDATVAGPQAVEDAPDAVETTDTTNDDDKVQDAEQTPPALAEVKAFAQAIIEGSGDDMDPTADIYVLCRMVLALPEKPVRKPRTSSGKRGPRNVEEGSVNIATLSVGTWFSFAGSDGRLCLAARQTGTRLRFAQQRKDGPTVWAMSNRSNGAHVVVVNAPTDEVIFNAAVAATGKGSVGQAVRAALGIDQ